MALASRLNLRLQKEIKLLLTDPPPGASFPSLADGSSASSLTSIDALLQGPEGSVYANGLFKIKIQIPERYPFQPPVVTFATPIYHPNIDTGGRICLDILNLPPKGSWQPSLNISTVLTSIGLLLSEPNPDDGLMHEASREYKYNRQAFDQNARSMTEKYARARESEGTEDRHGSHSHSGPSTKHSDMQGSNASMLVTEDMACHERSSGSSMKMSSKILESCSNTLEAPIHDCLMNDTAIQQLKANSISVEHAENPGNLLATRGKLSLKTSVVSHGRNGKHGSSDLANRSSSGLENRTIALNSRSLSPLVHVGGNYDGKGSKTFSGSSTGLSLKKTGLVGLKSSGAGVSPRLHLLKNKENLHSLQCLPHQQRDPPSAAYKRPGKQVVAEDLKQSQTATELLKKPRGQVLNCKSADAVVLNYDNASSCHPKSLLAENNIRSNDEQHLDHDFNKSSDKLSKCTEDTLKLENTIVLDSEDSEDERVPVRSKLSLSKRNLTRKRKSSY